MKTTIAMKPHIVASKPFSMLALPMLGPTVRSSMISIGAASAPARIRSERARVSLGVKAPVIWERLANARWRGAADLARGGRHRDGPALFLREQDDRIQVFDVPARHAAHGAAAGVVEVDR